jgi:hypothetical protein
LREPARLLFLRDRSGAMSDYEFTMSLRVRHPEIDPALITRMLGLQPQHTWRAGDVRKGTGGDCVGGTYHESYWVCALMSAPKLATEQVGVESELQQALTTLRRSFDFLQSLHASGGATEVYISIFAREEFRIELLADIAALLGRLGITLALEVKPHSTSVPAVPVS